MKIQCEQCKEIVPLGRFEILADRIRVTCSACAGSFEVVPEGVESARRAPAPPNATETATEGATKPRCPKCGEPHVDAPACPVCGLEAQHAAAFSERQAAEASPELDAQWDACIGAWDDQSTHDAFARAASLGNQFSAAARRYRIWLVDHPGDPGEEIARAALGRLARMAEVSLLHRPSKPAPGDDEQPYKRVVMLMIALVVLAAMGGAYLLVRQVMEPEPAVRALPGADPASAPNARPARAPNGAQGGGIVAPVRRAP
jgi:hypothetical protein